MLSDVPWVNLPKVKSSQGSIGLTWLVPFSGRERILINRLKFRISEYTSGEGNAPKANAGTITGRGVWMLGECKQQVFPVKAILPVMKYQDFRFFKY